MTPKGHGPFGVVEREWHRFQDSIDSAPDEAFDRPVFTGEGEGWRLRDLLAHIAFWQGMGTRVAERMSAEGIGPGPDDRIRSYVGETASVDQLNAAAAASAAGKSPAQIRADLVWAHSRLVDAMRAVPDDLLLTGEGEEDFVGQIWQPSVNHLRQHREHIETALNDSWGALPPSPREGATAS